MSAAALKEEGNKFFKAQEYEVAIKYYSQSIEADGGKNYAVFTNRALARIKLSQWEKVIQDCKASLELNKQKNVKGYYFLSQALLEVEPRQSKDALSNGLQAYELCVRLDDKSIKNVVGQILKCKKAIWEDQNKAETLTKTKLLEKVKKLMQEDLDTVISNLPTGSSVPVDLHREHENQLRLLESSLFPRPAVPEWLIDDISFSCMHDPVLTKNGKSYERATLLEHLRKSQTDPVTREPLLISDLKPNLELAQACDDFLRENGWAVDY